MARDEGYRNVAMLVELSEGTESPANVFKSVFTEQMGGSITEDVRFNAGETTYAAQVAQAFESNPDAVYIAAGFETGRAAAQRVAAPRLRRHTPDPDDRPSQPRDRRDRQRRGGRLSHRPAATAYDTENNPAWDAYVPRFEAKIGDPPEIAFYDAWQYDQYIVLGLAMAKAGTTDGAAVAAAVLEIANPPGKEVFSYAEGLAELDAGNDIDYHGTTSNMNLNSVGNLLSP